MKTTLAILLSCIVSALPMRGQDAVPALKALSFISGCWEINRPERKSLVSEQWMTAEGGAMMGMSRTVRNGRMTAFEFLRIVESDAGIHYISKPSQNKEETAFKLVKWSASEATFENPTHDFPQRIIYRRDKSNLFARIEGNNEGKFMGIDFPMTRAKCD